MVNPFPLVPERRRRRAGAHRSPMEPRRNERAGQYRPKLVQRRPRCIPDEKFNELFAGLGSHRDRALVAFWVSTGARASELLGACGGDIDAGQQPAEITALTDGHLPCTRSEHRLLRLTASLAHGIPRRPAGNPDQP